jgi:hypothetical protein
MNISQWFRSIAKSSPEFIRTSMLAFFNSCAEDLGHTITNLREGKYPHLRQTHLKTSTSLNYINTVVLPVITALFDHSAAYEFGSDIIRKFLRKCTMNVFIFMTYFNTLYGENFMSAFDS